MKNMVYMIHVTSESTCYNTEEHKSQSKRLCWSTGVVRFGNNFLGATCRTHKKV